MARRLFYAQDWEAGRAYLRGDKAAHLRRVLRAEKGQLYELSDGERLWLGRIERVGKETVEFALLKELPGARTGAPVHLMAALFKFDHFEWMIEKATELGVERITPVETMRCEKGLAEAVEKRRARWERIVREAGQQSRRLRPPEVGPVIQLREALAMEAEARLFLEEASGASPLLKAVNGREGRIAVLCGPEGGWDDRERRAAREARWESVSLGPTILRAETAAVGVLAVLVAAREAARAS